MYSMALCRSLGQRSRPLLHHLSSASVSAAAESRILPQSRGFASKLPLGQRPFDTAVTATQLPEKPRTTAITEVRGPFTDPIGKRRLWDLIDTVGPEVDGIKFVGGAAHTMQRSAVVDLVEIAHEHDLYVCESGLLEHAASQGPKAVRRYVWECRDLHFDCVELPDACAGSLPEPDLLRMYDDLQEAGLTPKPKVGVWSASSAGGTGFLRHRAFDRGIMSSVTEAILKCRQFQARGAPVVTIDSLAVPGEDAIHWREDVVRRLIDELGAGRLLFEAPHPKVFSWFVTKFGPEVNLHVDWTQVVHLQCLRRSVLYPPMESLVYDGMASSQEAGLE